MQLRLLVGTNLVRLSQLDDASVEMYQDVILPGILEQTINCRDNISQEYLMECIIQVFPDNFHLSTLQRLLTACISLQPGVNVRAIVVSLIERLVQYLRDEEGKAAAKNFFNKNKSDTDLYQVFSGNVASVIKVVIISFFNCNSTLQTIFPFPPPSLSLCLFFCLLVSILCYITYWSY